MELPTKPYEGNMLKTKDNNNKVFLWGAPYPLGSSCLIFHLFFYKLFVPSTDGHGGAIVNLWSLFYMVFLILLLRVWKKLCISYALPIFIPQLLPQQ